MGTVLRNCCFVTFISRNSGKRRFCRPCLGGGTGTVVLARQPSCPARRPEDEARQGSARRPAEVLQAAEERAPLALAPPSARRAGGGGSRPPASSRGPSVSPTRGREPGTAGVGGAHRTQGWPPEGRPTQDARPGPCGDRGDGGRRVTAWSTSCRGLCSGRPLGWGSCFRPSPRCRTWSRLGLSLQREQDA